MQHIRKLKSRMYTQVELSTYSVGMYTCDHDLVFTTCTNTLNCVLTRCGFDLIPLVTLLLHDGGH